METYTRMWVLARHKYLLNKTIHQAPRTDVIISNGLVMQAYLMEHDEEAEEGEMSNAMNIE